MRSKIILGGRFRVTDEGDVFRIRDGVEEPQKITVQTVERRKGPKQAAVFCYCDGGGQHTLYVPRAVAEAFVPNPDKLPYVHHKDGNPLNNRADNLEWATMSDIVSEASAKKTKEQRATGKKCPYCGASTWDEVFPCRFCVNRAAARENRKRLDKNRAAQVHPTVGSNASDQSREIIRLARAGTRIQEIADKFGVSRQRVYQIIGKVPKPQDGVSPEEMERLRARIPQNVSIMAIAKKSKVSYQRLLFAVRGKLKSGLTAEEVQRVYAALEKE